MPAMATKDWRRSCRQVWHRVTLNKALLIAQNDHMNRSDEKGVKPKKSRGNLLGLFSNFRQNENQNQNQKRQNSLG